MVWLEQVNLLLVIDSTLENIFGLYYQNQVRETKEFAYFTLDQIFGLSNRRIFLYN